MTKKKDDVVGGAFRPREVRSATGMSHRQLQNWEQKGAAAGDRAREGGWRTYSAREMFVILINCAFREGFGVPLERLNWLRDFMLQKGADHFRYVYDRAARSRMTTFLVTDLKEIFFIGTDLDVAENFELGYFRDAEESASLFILKLNPILQQILDMAGEQLPDVRQNGYEVYWKGRKLYTAQTLEEVSILSLTRMKGIQSFRIEFRDDAPHRAVVETDEEPNADLLALLNDAPFQKVTVTQSNGKTRQLKREVSWELEKNVDESGNRIPLAIRITK
jgi:hypothetical protein